MTNYTESVSFSVHGPWGSGSADSADEARADAAKARAETPDRRDEIEARWRVWRTWGDDSQWTSADMTLGDDEPDPTAVPPALWVRRAAAGAGKQGRPVIPCDCGPPMAYDVMTDRYRCARQRCHHRIAAETRHRYLTLLD